MSGGPGGARGGVWSAAGWLGPPDGFVAGRPRAALLFLVPHGCPFIYLFVVC